METPETPTESPLWQQFEIGDRIVVRTRLPEGEVKRYSDVIGVVVFVDDVQISVRKDAAGYDRDGGSGIEIIQWAEVETAKKIPARPQPHPSRASAGYGDGYASTRPSRPADAGHVGAPPISLLSRMSQLDKAIEPTIFHLPQKYSMADIAEQAGTTVDHVFSMTRLIGSYPSDANAINYTDWDLEAVQDAMAFAEAEGLDEFAMSTLLRGMGFAMERLTTRQVEAVIQQFDSDLNVGDTEARLLAAAQLPKQAEGMLKMLAHVYRRHLAISTRRLTTDTIAQRGLLSDDNDYPLVRAIGFADMVDFTNRTQKATAREFTNLIQNFRDTTWDIINAGHGRTINFIGDAVFFVADTIEQGADIALALAEPDALGISGPVRVGLVWSRIIATHGDAYGPGVNLAARLCAASEPGEVLIGPLATAMLGRSTKYQVTPQPPVDAHGIGPVTVSRLRHANDPRSESE